MIPQPIPYTPALHIEDGIIIADLHIGIENELREHGVYAASKTYSMKEKLVKLLEEYKPMELFILGDVKHSIPSTPFQEKRELEEFFQTIQRYVERIHILPGNHDGGLEKLLPRGIEFHSSNGIVIDDIGLLHGHSWPSEELMKTRIIVFAHTHPTIKLKDRMGLPVTEQCWVKGFFIEEKLREKYSSYNRNLQFLIMPSFNPLCGGVAVNEEELVGPMKNIINILEAEVYLLDGSLLGILRNL